MTTANKRLAPADFFCQRYSIGRTTWWRLTQTPGFPEPVRFGRSVRWNVEQVEIFIGDKV